jgi:hypothetical protein
MREFESSHSSQPVRRSEKMSLILAERPTNGVLSRTGGQSLDSEFVQFRSKIADSLRQTFEKLPFFGRLRLETGFDLHCAAELALAPKWKNRSNERAAFVILGRLRVPVDHRSVEEFLALVGSPCD